MIATIEPQDFTPQAVDLLGDARTICERLLSRIERQREKDNARLKILLCGKPGVGKSRVGQILSAALVGANGYNVRLINGRDLSVDAVREMASTWSRSLFDDWMVLQVEEFDVCPRAAQDALLTLLDSMPPRRAFIATSNQHLQELSERLQTRLQYFELETPSTDEIRQLLMRWSPPLSAGEVQDIAERSAGNVRAALLDAQSYIDAYNN